MGYLSLTEADRRHMLAEIGVSSVAELFSPIPPAFRSDGLSLPAGLSELETRARLRALAARNRPCRSSSFLGAGCYQHLVPAAVSALVARGEFATAYTSYQAEVSQGTLQAIFEFQTSICELTGLEVANASMYDGPSATAEAVFMALRQTKRERIACSAGVHPEVLEVVQTYASGPGFAVEVLDLDGATGTTAVVGAAGAAAAASAAATAVAGAANAAGVAAAANAAAATAVAGAAGVASAAAMAVAGAAGATADLLPGLSVETGALVVQQPNFFGVIEDTAALAEAAHAVGALLVVIQNPLTLALLEAPGKLGADIVTGDVQPFGNAMSFGGPSAGYLACREAYLRQIPGRLVGQTVDADGRTCYTLTLQAREQHIRRAKATSNICSNEALNALAATIYLALLGPEGLAELAGICLERAHYLQAGLASVPGITPGFTGPFFHEFVLRIAGGASSFASALRSHGIDPGVPLGCFSPEWEDLLLVAVTEMNSPADLDSYIEAAREAARGVESWEEPCAR
jgi:glycine dehydrogenase subunit 1